MTVRLVLPWPPTANHIWAVKVKAVRGKWGRVRYVGYVYLTDEARQYKADVANMVRLTRANGDVLKDAMTGPVRYTLTLHNPDRRRRDRSNSVKLIEDSLTEAGVWLDDSQVDEFHVKRGPVVKGGRAVIEIEAMG